MIRLALALWLLADSAVAQGWPDLDRLLFSTLTRSGTAEASFWLPDTPDPAQATRAMGIVYEYIPGSAGNTNIAVGIYVRGVQGWQFAGQVQGLFGQSPSAPQFSATHAEVSTMMPGPNDPRCCPTQVTRWRIDLRTLAAQRLN